MQGVGPACVTVMSVAVFSLSPGGGQRSTEQSAADADSLQPSPAGTAAYCQRHGSGQMTDILLVIVLCLCLCQVS